MIKISIKNPNKYELYDDYGVIIINSPTYGIFKEKLDIEDFKNLKQYQWNINKCMNKKTNKNPIFYAGTNHYGSSNNTALMHRIIMNAPKGKVVDHINHDACDNRKSNLRICTQKENLENSNQYYGNKSGVRGVCWGTKDKRWKAYIRVNYKFMNLGEFIDIKDAIKARKDAEEKYITKPEYNQLIKEIKGECQ